MPPAPAAFCKKCGGPRHYTGSRWRCAKCNMEAQRRQRETASAETLAKYRATRRASRAKWPPERRAAKNAEITKWREANRERHRAGSRDWYRRNAERILADKSDYYRANVEAFIARNLVRKARMRDAVCEHGAGCVDRDFLAVLWSSQCVYCGAAAEHADHVKPLSRGGLHCRDNLVPACAPCNLSKYVSDPDQWAERRSSA